MWMCETILLLKMVQRIYHMHIHMIEYIRACTSSIFKEIERVKDFISTA